MEEVLLTEEVNYQSVVRHCSAINDERRRITVICAETNNAPRKCTLCNILPYKDAVYFFVKELPNSALHSYNIAEGDAIICDLYSRVVNNVLY